jgi:STE24 endopeptidase
VTQSVRVNGVGAVAAAVVAADLAVRLLSPRPATAVPAPVDPREHFSAAEIARGRRYARPQLALSLAGTVIELTALTALVRRRARRAPEEIPEDPGAGRSTASELACAAATGAALTVGLTALNLPLSAISRRRALAAGLATQTWRDWASDLAKSTVIEAAFGATAATVVTGLSRRWPNGWWAAAAGGALAAGAGISALGPVLLDPLFNDFTPVPAGELRDDILALARAAGVKVGGVYSVDASRRTTAANAYVNGLGPSKRVVLFDTLLDRYSRDEIRFVVAHELGHVRHRDVPRLLAFAGITAPAAAFAVQRLSWSLTPERGTAGAVPALLLSTWLVSLPAGLQVARLSRAIERRTDDFAYRLSGAPAAAASFMRAIAVQNLADLEPPRWLTALMATHPSTGERIAAALTQTRSQTPAGS